MKLAGWVVVMMVGCGGGSPPSRGPATATATETATATDPATETATATATDTATATATETATDTDPATDPVRRSGIQVRYVGLDTTGGVEGRAFLPVSSRDVVIAAASVGGACARSTSVTATGRLQRGPVRALRVELRASGPGRIEIGPAECQSAVISVTLDEGSTLVGGGGHIEVESLDVGGFVTGSYSFTTLHNNEPITVQGTFTVRRPAS